jgi:hypothetical protein
MTPVIQFLNVLDHLTPVNEQKLLPNVLNLHFRFVALSRGFQYSERQIHPFSQTKHGQA